MDALVRHLESRSAELSRRALAEMYEDPFWLARFGARGQRFAEQDGEYHVSYLVSALALGNADVFTGYARWLQTLLVSRGMCTRHVAENFERLAQVIAADVADAQPAVDLLHVAVEALRYDGGPARALQELSERLADAVVARGEAEGAGLRRKDVLDLLSYLADAVHLDRTGLFAAHVEWLAGFFEGRRVPAEHLRWTLARLDLELAELAGDSKGLGAATHRFLGEALARISVAVTRDGRDDRP